MIEIPGLADIRPVLAPLADGFRRRGHRLYLVGGAVRDLLVAHDDPAAATADRFDLDLTTDARPEVIRELLGPTAEALWGHGERFGTIGARIGGYDLEVTTHRAEAYDPDSRKPVVSFGDDLGVDLSRRDFTINAMAIEVPGEKLHDPYGGRADLEARILRTPLSPEVSFTDDPLRMLRAAIFIARYRLTPTDELRAAAIAMVDRLTIMSVERINNSLEKLLATADPTPGLAFLRETGLLSRIVPALADEGAADIAIALAAAGRSSGGPGSPGPLLRRAGLLWPLGLEARSVLRHLRYSNDDTTETMRLITAVADLIRADPGADPDCDPDPDPDPDPDLDPGPDPGTVRRAAASVGADGLDAVLALLAGVGRHDPGVDSEWADRARATVERLRASEDLTDLGSPLSGREVMALLGLPPGPDVGRAQRYLIEHRLDHGPLRRIRCRRSPRSMVAAGKRSLTFATLEVCE